jgi:Ankyrin repeats (3 copies)
MSGRHKEVVDYVGAPPQLSALENMIDAVVNSKRWVSIDTETVHEKCRQGWDVNGKEARSLLLHAVITGDTDVVRAFIEEGANVKKSVGHVPLLSVARGREVFEALIAAGEDVNVRPEGYLYPPLLRAAELGEPDSLEILIKAGANVDAESSGGTTALMLAAQSGVPASVKLLLASGANAGKKDEFGKTAVDYARSGEENSLTEEQWPDPYGGPIPDFRPKFEEIRKLLTAR